MPLAHLVIARETWISFIETKPFMLENLGSLGSEIIQCRPVEFEMTEMRQGMCLD